MTPSGDNAGTQVTRVNSSRFDNLKVSGCQTNSSRIRHGGRIRAPPLGSADFQVGCIADFQIREPGMVQVALEFCCVSYLEIGDMAGLETATGRCADASCVMETAKYFLPFR